MRDSTKLVTDFSRRLQSYLSEDVFYLPSFGPVYSHGEDLDQLVSGILRYWKDKIFLPYDKGKRWFNEKEEYIYVPQIQLDGDDIYLPVLNTFGKTSLKVHVYSHQEVREGHLQNVKALAEEIKGEEKITKVSLVTTKKPKLDQDYHASNLYFKHITRSDKIEQYPEEIKVYDELPKEVQRTFEGLANEEDLVGSQMLWYRFLYEGQKLSTIIVAVEDDQVLGMIGPMDTLADPWGKLQLLAPYFEVSRKARRKGFGSKLWQTALNWAWQNKAEYLLIQAEEGEAADYFYPKVGLEQKGTLYSYPVLTT